MAKVTIAGKEYELLYNLYALEMIEEEFGGIREMFDAMKEERHQTRDLGRVFVILANAAKEAKDEPEDVTIKVYRRAKQWELMGITDAVKVCIAEGMRSEKTGGNEADDEAVDIFTDEDDEKNG